MNPLYRVLSLSLFLFSLGGTAIWLNSSAADTYSGWAHASDGDSIAITEYRLRLSGIDAPELHQTCVKKGRSYPCGYVARAYVQALLDKAKVMCTATSHDKYGRALVVCHQNGEDLNARLVRDGWAVSYGRYKAEEKAAQASGVGLWAGTFTRPDVIRRQEREHAQKSWWHLW
jgi:endonuclease YncB( thermonuclease family)